MNNEIINNIIFQNMKDLLKDKMPELINKYRTTADQLMCDIERAIKAGDATALSNAAHTLKSSSKQLGATRFADIVLILEAAGKSNKLEDIAETYQQAKIMYDEVRQELQK